VGSRAWRSRVRAVMQSPAGCRHRHGRARSLRNVVEAAAHVVVGVRRHVPGERRLGVYGHQLAPCGTGDGSVDVRCNAPSRLIAKAPHEVVIVTDAGSRSRGVALRVWQLSMLADAMSLRAVAAVTNASRNMSTAGATRMHCVRLNGTEESRRLTHGSPASAQGRRRRLSSACASLRSSLSGCWVAK
jgi:hypothetical protein